tara:strand:+ start:420 stop:839 length:420 start_codon:yes stop_codon:yes gene_type:complete
VPAHHGLADGRPNSGSADNEYMCACMEGYEEKTPYAPSHKVHQCLLITALLPTATTPEPMHALAHTVAPTYAPTPAEPGHLAATALPLRLRPRRAVPCQPGYRCSVNHEFTKILSCASTPDEAIDCVRENQDEDVNCVA